MATIADPPVFQGHDIPGLAEWSGLPKWRITREIQIATSLGELCTQKVGISVFLPVAELESLKRWLTKRGLWRGEA